MKWKQSGLTEREVRLIKNCQDYAKVDPAGLPGHNLMVIISKLADKLNDNEREKITSVD